MAEYINRERARFEAKRYFKNMDEIQEDLDMLFCMLPAENVAPVRHGRWIAYVNEYGEKRHYCSECKKDAHRHYSEYRNDVIELLFDYCPNCGAIMDGGAD